MRERPHGFAAQPFTGAKKGPAGANRAASSGKFLAIDSQTIQKHAPIAASWIILEHTMKHQRHFDTYQAAQRENALMKMIDELDRSVQLLNADIAIEENRVWIFDRSDAAYPILARGLAARRDNLMDTIDELKKRLPLDQGERVAELA